jgi:hypothetical protein
MKNYLSFGGGVNSVALYLYLADQGIDFEAVFVDHGGDWPETYEYVEMFSQKYPLTTIEPKDGNLYQYCWDHKMVPATWPRWCTSRFKLDAVFKYYKKPCFQFVGLDAGESHRAKIYSVDGVETRWPLIEAGIDRQGCKDLISKHGLPVPHKSGCFICPFQTIAEWKELRMNHPDLFCLAEKLEQRNMNYRISKGKKPLYLYGNAKPLRVVVDENQMRLWAEDEYPPCECGL